jgi:tetratricopeptide (TPR) repeat protein
LELDPASVAAHSMLGIVQRIHRGDYGASLDWFARALALNPNHASSHAHQGRTLAIMGRPGEAIEHVQRAIRLSPHDLDLPLWLFFIGEASLEIGDFDAALDHLRRAAELDPNNPRIHGALAATYAHLGHADEAARHIAEFENRSGPQALARLRSWVDRNRGQTKAYQPRLIEGLRLAFGAS